jgi:flagellar hook assembly protein FlgD
MELVAEIDYNKTRIYATPAVAPLSVDGRDGSLPVQGARLQNYPNPFNPTTYIEFQVQMAGHVRLCIYNSLGQLVTTLVDELRGVGDYSVEWNGSAASGAAAASGVYFYQLEVGEFVSTKKMVLLK